MTFYGLYNELYFGVETRIQQLENACNKLGIKSVFIQESNCDILQIPRLEKSDLLYSIADGVSFLETYLLQYSPKTFYIKNVYEAHVGHSINDSIFHSFKNIRQPKTIFHYTNNRSSLKSYVEYLGGFPLILKVKKGSRGVGTIKIETWQNLISTVDFFIAQNIEFIFREYINAKTGCRMTVLGNEVIAAADFVMNKDDFRNAVIASEIKYLPRVYSNELIQIAIDATRMCNIEFAGVDFLEDENGNFYLLEINFPTGFSGLIDVCNVDIPFKMIEYLKNK